MRIVAGKFGGLEISAPKGRDVRPTTNRVREAMFSSLGSLKDIQGAQVLDAFAGSGALGIEALSRGALNVVFCEHNRSTVKNLINNLDFIHAQKSQFKIINTDVFKYVFSSDLQFDIVFLDPPYATSDCDVLAFLTRLIEDQIISEGCVIVYEHSDKALNDSFCKTFNLIKTKKYGKIVVSYLRFGE